jgi:hypothetical protein
VIIVGILQTRFSAFIRLVQGVPGVGDTYANKGQCVGLVEAWLDAVNHPHVWGNAKDLLANATPVFYTRVDNTPVNFPALGDIVVWGATWGGGYGHCGVVSTATPMSLNVFEQNDPTGSPPHMKTYDYDGVIGWLVLKGVK